MTKYHLHKPIYSLLLVFIFLTSSNGQTSTPAQTAIKTEPTSISTGQTKLVKTHGSTKIF